MSYTEGTALSPELSSPLLPSHFISAVTKASWNLGVAHHRSRNCSEILISPGWERVCWHCISYWHGIHSFVQTPLVPGFEKESLLIWHGVHAWPNSNLFYLLFVQRNPEFRFWKSLLTIVVQHSALATDCCRIAWWIHQLCLIEY